MTCRAIRCTCPIGSGSKAIAQIKVMSGLTRRKTLCGESPRFRDESARPPAMG